MFPVLDGAQESVCLLNDYVSRIEEIVQDPNNSCSFGVSQSPCISTPFALAFSPVGSSFAPLLQELLGDVACDAPDHHTRRVAPPSHRLQTWSSPSSNPPSST